MVFLVLPTLMHAGDRNGAGKSGLYFDFGSFGRDCNGDCGAMVFAGRQTSVPMAFAFGIADFTDGKYGFHEIAPIWDWPWEDSGVIGATFSRRIGSFGHASVGEVISLEGEVGAAKRFGSQTEMEFWGALYLRWHLFPWNKFVKTTVGVSTGLNWASGISTFEANRSGNGEGSKLLHYLSPEITFALPDKPDVELVFRFHHRSGGADMFGANSIFNNSGGGSQYATIGTRWRF